MIRVRSFDNSEIPAINEVIAGQKLGVPTLNNLIVNAILVDEKETIFGYGCVKLFAEAILLLKERISKKLKAQAVRASMKSAILFAKDAGVETLYIVSNDKGFSTVLRKTYGFRSYPGELLILDLEDVEGKNG